MASIKCGNCTGTHASVAEVRMCHAVGTLGAETVAYAPVTTAPRTVPQANAEVPDGRYCITFDGKVRFFIVDTGKNGRWAGFQFVSEQAGDEKYPVRGRGRKDDVLAAIRREGVKEASLRYGHELGHCGVCGRTLTDESSRAAGIGPVCAGKMGW
jgi:hypothetical protein